MGMSAPGREWAQSDHRFFALAKFKCHIDAQIAGQAMRLLLARCRRIARKLWAKTVAAQRPSVSPKMPKTQNQYFGCQK